MTDQEYTELEILLGKLRGVIGQQFIIMPNYVFDGFYIATYHPYEMYKKDEKSGTVDKEVSGPTIKSLIEKLK